MRKFAFVLALASLAAACGKSGQNAGAVTTVSGGNETATVEYGSYTEPVSFNVYKVAELSNDPVMDDAEYAGEFYPIGWSRDGKFAYALYSDFHEFVGACSDLRIYIQDMATDKVVWKFAISTTARRGRRDIQPGLENHRDESRQLAKFRSSSRATRSARCSRSNSTEEERLRSQNGEKYETNTPTFHPV
jgi:hypothetical protein